jgi:hypothetical protein
VKVNGGVPDQVPSDAFSVALSVAVPLMAGRAVLAGGVLGAIRPSSSTS